MRSRIKHIFEYTGNVDRSSYIWNTVAGLAIAMQSAIVLMVMTRTNGLNDAGIFSIAYAIAGLMLFLGEFGVRKYQVSDVNEDHSFADYYTFRIITCLAMIIAGLLYACYGLLFCHYTMNKFIVVMLVLFIKVIDTFADVFYGRFQQKGRLDVAAKTTSFRVILGMISCIIMLIFTHNLILSLIVWFLVTLVAMFLSTFVVSPDFCTIEVQFNYSQLKAIFIACFPLFLGTFLLLYVGNAPKYAIDACMDDIAQAKFNFIFMPVFVIEMLANFIFNPVLVKLAESWDNCDFRQFKKMVIRQIWVITGITVFTTGVSYFIGCPILSILFGTDLNPERDELCILLIGGGMLALVNFFTVVVTVIRRQSRLSIGYIATAVLAWLFSRYFVAHYGIMGAAILYTFLMTILALAFAIIMIVSIKKDKAKALQAKREESC